MPFPATDNVYDVRKTYSQYQSAKDYLALPRQSSKTTSFREGRECIATHFKPVNSHIVFFYLFFISAEIARICAGLMLVASASGQ